MLKKMKIGLGLIFVFVLAIVYKCSRPPGCLFSCQPSPEPFLTERDVMSRRSGIIFVETTDRLEPPPLVSCSVESAARIYPDRPIRFFMKGLNNNTSLDLESTSAALSSLSAMKNVFLLPLQTETFFEETPLLSWYRKAA